MSKPNPRGRGNYNTGYQSRAGAQVPRDPYYQYQAAATGYYPGANPYGYYPQGGQAYPAGYAQYGFTPTPTPPPVAESKPTVEERPKRSRIVVSRPDSKEVLYDVGTGTNNLRVSSGAVRNTPTPTSPTTPNEPATDQTATSPSPTQTTTIQVSAPASPAPAQAQAEPQPQKSKIVVSSPANKSESPSTPAVEEKDSKPVEAAAVSPVVPLETQTNQSNSENEKKESNENQILPETKPEEQIQTKSEEKDTEKQEENTKELQIESEPTKTQENSEEKEKQATENEETPKEQAKPAENEQKATQSDAKPEQTEAKVEKTEEKAATVEATATEPSVKQENESKEAPEVEKKEEGLPKPEKIEEGSEENEDSWETKGDEELNESVKEHALNKLSEEESERRRKYSKDFLLQFKETNTSKPAEMLNLDQIMIAKQEPAGNSGGNDRGYIKNSGKGGFNARGSGPKSGGNRGKNFKKSGPQSPKVNPKLAAKEKLTDRQKSLKSAKSILNKIAPDTFDKLSKEIGSLVTAELLEEITELIFEKAVTEPKYADLYAKLCVRLLSQDSTGFRKKLLSLCQKEFEQLKEHEANKELEVLVSETGDDYQIRKRMRGNMEFVGELFNQPNGISSKIIFICFKELIHENFNEELTANQIKGINVKLEAFCKLATTVGKKLDQQQQKSQDQSLDYYFKILKELYLTSSLIEPRLKFAIQDVIELRLNRWIPRREAEKPKTIQEVHAAAAKQEQQKAALSAASPSRGKPHSYSRPDTPKGNLRQSGEWQSGGGKGGKGGKKPVKQQQPKSGLTQKNAFEQLSTKAPEKPKELDKDKFKGKSFIFMEEIYGIGEIDLSEFDVLSEEPTSEERNLLVENILAFLSEKNKDIKLASLLLEELFNKKYIYPNNLEHGFTTIVKNFIDIVDDLPNFPTRIATMLSNLFPNFLANFAFLNEPLAVLDDELSSVVTNFVGDLIKLTTAKQENLVIAALKLESGLEIRGIIATTKKLLTNPDSCAKWLENSVALDVLSNKKLLEEISKAISNLFFKGSFSDSPSEETLKDEQAALAKFSPIFELVKPTDLLPVLKTFLKEGLYSRVEATITKS